MTTEQIRGKLKLLHEAENEINKKIAKADVIIKGLIKEKATLGLRVSKNMKYRNKLINKL
jgi:hypothetical protein